MTRLHKLALFTVGATFFLIVVGAIVRVTGSGLGCPDWPLCYGQVLPAPGDHKAWIEWTHRTIAAVIGFLVLGVAILALRHHRRQPSIVVPAIAAVLLTGAQAVLGKITVETGNSGESVTAHLAAAMLLLGLLTYIAVRTRYPQRLPAGGATQRFTLLAAFAAAAVYGLLLFGSNVTARGAALVFPDWPLFDGSLLPRFAPDSTFASLQLTHFLHRLAALVVGVIVIATAWVSWRASRRRSFASVAADDRSFAASAGHPTVMALATTAAALYLVQVVVGGLQIFTLLAGWAVALHLALGAAIWGLLVAAVVASYGEARTFSLVRNDPGKGGIGGSRARARVGPDGRPHPVGSGIAGRSAMTAGIVDLLSAAPAATMRQKVGAYVALTKPRIIELLLVTTVPAMFLAARGVPRLDLVAWTLLGGALAAGSANAINQYLERDIDQLMNRTRRRPLPQHQVEPENAFLFGLALGVIAFAELALLVNLLSAFLALLAIAFYVVVYTLLLKRNTPQNIVIGGAAGSLPPVIGWAAVTDDIALPALLLFAIVFYWTPPHFWALSLRLLKDYRAAGVPMLPVVRGIPETTRQIALYSLLLIALTLVFFAVARMGLLYLLGALVLGAAFLYHALRMWQDGTEARAVRLYKFSTSYLTALFAVMMLDVMVPITL